MDQEQVNEMFVRRVEQLEPHLFHRVMGEITVSVLSQQLSEVSEADESSEDD